MFLLVVTSITIATIGRLIPLTGAYAATGAFTTAGCSFGKTVSMAIGAAVAEGDGVDIIDGAFGNQGKAHVFSW